MENIASIISKFLLIALAAFFAWWLLKAWRRRKTFGAQAEEDSIFGETRAQKKQRLDDLKQKHQCVEDLFIWFDARLMENRKAHDIKAELISEWCCEDKTGKADYPMRSRPSEMTFASGGRTQRFSLDWDREDSFLTASETKLLAWGLMQRCSTLIPFRFYRMEARRSIRTFTVKNNVPVAWQDDTATLESYTISIS